MKDLKGTLAIHKVERIVVGTIVSSEGLGKRTKLPKFTFSKTAPGKDGVTD